jgi:hypothetical protein
MAITEASNRRAAVDRASEQVQEDLNSNSSDALSNNPAPLSKVDYNVKDYAYPDGISVDDDKQHYIQFFINVRGNSKFNTQTSRDGFKQELLENVKVGQGQNRVDPNKAEQQTGLGIALAGAAAGATGGGIASLFGTKKGSGVKQVLTGTALGAVAAAGLKKLDILKADVPKRLKDVITLHIQDRPAVNYSVQYQEDELGLGAGLAAGGSGAVESTGSTGDLVKEVATAAGASVVNTLGRVLASSPSRLLQTGTKLVANPFREQFFERVDFRTFNFRHTFMPKSESEAKKVRDIIRMFKFHMHPELAAGKGLFFLYPSEFEIKYFYRGKENSYFNKISTCVLEDMNVEYGGDIFATFETGEPIEVNMTLRFKELEVLTKERVAEGY